MLCRNQSLLLFAFLLILGNSTGASASDRDPPHSSKLRAAYAYCKDLIRTTLGKQDTQSLQVFRDPGAFEFSSGLSDSALEKVVARDDLTTALYTQRYELLIPPNLAKLKTSVVSQILEFPGLPPQNAIKTEDLRDGSVVITIPEVLSSDEFFDYADGLSHTLRPLPFSAKISEKVPLLHAPDPSTPGARQGNLDYPAILNGLFKSISQKLKIVATTLGTEFLARNASELLVERYSQALRDAYVARSSPTVDTRQAELVLSLIALEATNDRVVDLNELLEISRRHIQYQPPSTQSFFAAVQGPSDSYRLNLDHPHHFPGTISFDLRVPSGGRVNITMSLMLSGRLNRHRTVDICGLYSKTDQDTIPQVEFFVRPYPTNKDEIPTKKEIYAIAKLIRQAASESFAQVQEQAKSR